MLALILASTAPVLAGPAPIPLAEETLREVFTFGPDDTLKYAECDTKKRPACSYIWGPVDADDAARIKLGGKPDGKKLVVVYAEAGAPEDFSRVLSSYSDAQPVEDLGVQAVWSPARQQLSLITQANLIIHVNTERAGTENAMTAAITVARRLPEIR